MQQKTMGAFISALRKANGMTQQELADRLGVSNKAVSRWERDETAPDLSLIPAIAEIFGITCDELLKGERIFTEPEQEKSEPKVDRQLKALVNRSISGFKALIYIAIALSLIGLVAMFGIPAILNVINDFNPDAHPKTANFADIGLVFLFLFEIVAAILTAIAIGRMIDTKRNNELFASADQQNLAQYNRALFRYSYAALWTIFGAVVIALWFWCAWTERWPMPDYFFHLSALAVLILPAVFPRKLYRAWITGTPYRLLSEQIMDLLQLLFLILSAISFFLSSSKKLYEDVKWFHILLSCGWGFLSLVIITFLLFLWKNKEEKMPLLLRGIRNLCLCISVVFFHRSRYIKLYTSVFDGSVIPIQKSSEPMLSLAIGSAILFFALYVLFWCLYRKKMIKRISD